MKLTTLLFGLLLAVGWTNDAQAQLLPEYQARQKEMRVRTEMAPAPVQALNKGEAAPNQQRMAKAPQLNAPQRTNQFDLNATETRTKHDFDVMDPVTWTDLQGNPQSTLLTAPYTDANGIIALLTRIYTDPLIPGAKFSAPRMCDIPYQTIQRGWDIIGTNYNDPAVVAVNSSDIYIATIVVYDAHLQQQIGTLTPSSSNAPSGWESYYNYGDGKYYWHASSDTASFSLNLSNLNNTSGAAVVYVTAANIGTTQATVHVGNQTYDFAHYKLPANNTFYDCGYDFPGTITPPNDNGYTVALVKLNDGINADSTDMAPEYTLTRKELQDYFTKYVKEVQLLTDGLRVGKNGSNPGTAFAYTGSLNRFFFLGKGKMFYYSSLDSMDYDRAPFFSMYEEFSANDVADEDGYTDFYQKMREGESYAIVHDCMGVNYRQHYFSMAGKKGTTENDVSSLVFFIPDYRGVEGSDWRTYDPNHQPEIGMYIITLDAKATASEQEGFYTVNVTWDSNLDDITDNTVPQTYKLYEIYDKDHDGDMDTTLVYTGPNTQWNKDYKVGEPDSYPITYYVIGTPDGATNPEIFYDQSNDKTVIIPGENDFILLNLDGYESDYEVTEEKNYYRNYLSITNLEALGDLCVTAESVGANGRTLTLERDGVAVAYLDIKMADGKAYYRIRYVNPPYSDSSNPSNN